MNLSLADQAWIKEQTEPIFLDNGSYSIKKWGLDMSRKKENTDFICENCKKEVKALTNGSFRNHCPHCLHSKHLDMVPGDRASDCLGIMKPIGKRMHSKKGIQVVHECTRCGHIMHNKIAEDQQGDDWDLIIRLNVV